MEFDFWWANWHDYKTLDIAFSNPNNTDISLPQNWDTSCLFGLAAEIRALKNFPIRLGFVYGMTPIPDETVSPTLPDSNRPFIMGGFGDHQRMFKNIQPTQTSSMPLIRKTMQENPPVGFPSSFRFAGFISRRGLSARHGRPTLRAFQVEAGDSQLMGLSLPAVRANACTPPGPPQPRLPGPASPRPCMELRSITHVLAPFDIKGTNVLLWHYRDERQDNTFCYAPSIRRVMRVNLGNSPESFLGWNFCPNDAWGHADPS